MPQKAWTQEKAFYLSSKAYHAPSRGRRSGEVVAPLNVSKRPAPPTAETSRSPFPERGRHVAFAPLPEDSAHLRHPTRRPQQRPPSGRAGNVTALDHRVARHGGTTSTLEDLPHRLRQKNSESHSLQSRLEDLTRENGYLRQELAYHKDTREVLMRFHDSIRQSYQEMKVALDEASKGVAMSEQRLVDYWAGHPRDGSREEQFF